MLHVSTCHDSRHAEVLMQLGDPLDDEEADQFAPRLHRYVGARSG